MRSIIFVMGSSRFILAGLVCLARGEAPPLTQPEMQQVLRALRTDFAQPESVSFEALNRAAIAGLLEQHPQTMQLVTVPGAAAVIPPVRVESITPRIAGVRLHAWRKEDAVTLRAELEKLAAGETAAFILDLRAPAADADPALAMEFAALFLPKGTPVTASAVTAAEPAWTRDLIVLTDSDTTNAGEVLAAALQFHRRALLIGGTTRGRTATVAEVPLRKTEAGTLTLRYTAQRVAFPAGMSDPFGKGLSPDIAAVQDAEAKAAVFALQAKEGLARAVFSSARPRHNEASLVAKTNPEIPDRIARTAGQPAEHGNELIDRPLQLALDVLVARQSLEPGAPE